MSRVTKVDLGTLDPVERLIAEQAVLSARVVRQAMQGAPHGRGLEVTENAVVDQGRRQMQLVMEEMLKAQATAEKKGGAPVAAGDGRDTGPTRG